MKRRLCVLLLTGVLALGTAGISHADYMIGSQGPEVRNLQKRLNVYGFMVKADGNFNVATCNAVKKFQRRKHLSADGIVGPVTYKALMGKTMYRAKAERPSGRGNASIPYVGIDDSRVEWHKAGPVSDTVRAITDEAQKYVGVPYQFGGTTPSGFDCSGFTSYVFKNTVGSIPRVAQAQYDATTRVSRDDLLPGDLVFFGSSTSSISHVGIYVGSNQFIHAPSTGDVVKYSSLTGSYATRYQGAGRVIFE